MAFFGSMPPIGPIAVLLLERGVSGRDREGRGVALGAAIAETIYCALAMAGMSELMVRYAIVETIARGAGVLLLLGLGTYFARFTMKPRVPDSDRGKEARARGAVGLGFTVSIANPTLIITWSGSIGTLLSFAHLRLDIPERGAFVVGVFMGMFGWFQLFLWMLRRYRDRITLRAAKWSIRIAGVSMIALAIYGARLFFVH
jgi:threonine/homoserine/homoserine lactone efflux protein